MKLLLLTYTIIFALLSLIETSMERDRYVDLTIGERYDVIIHNIKIMDLIFHLLVKEEYPALW